MNDIEKLRNVVKEEKYINLLKTSDIEMIFDIIETENLTPKQTNNLVKTWVTNNRYGSSDNIVQAIIKDRYRGLVHARERPQGGQARGHVRGGIGVQGHPTALVAGVEGGEHVADLGAAALA